MSTFTTRDDIPSFYNGQPVFFDWTDARKAARKARGPVVGYLWHFGDMVPIQCGARTGTLR